ncbi:cache domain-containing protein [Patescibacteria group bacterium]
MTPLLVKKIKTRYIITLGILLVILLSSVFHLLLWVAANKLEASTVASIKKQNLAISQNGSHILENFFDNSQIQLYLLSELEAVKKSEVEPNLNALKLFAQQLNGKKDLYGAVGRVDKDGFGLGGINIPKLEMCHDCLGLSVKDRDYFIWAKEQTKSGNIYVTDPILARGGISKDTYIIIMATPVFYQNKFNGLVFLSFPLEKIKKQFITPLLISPDIKAALISEDDYILCSPTADSAGKTLAQRFEVKDERIKADFIKTINNIQNINEGSFILEIPVPEVEGDFQKIIVGVSQLKIANTKWYMAILTFYEDIENINQPLKNIRNFMVYFVSIGFLLLSLIFILGLRIAQSRGFLNGLNHNHKKKKKNK